MHCGRFGGAIYTILISPEVTKMNEPTWGLHFFKLHGYDLFFSNSGHFGILVISIKYLLIERYLNDVVYSRGM